MIIHSPDCVAVLDDESDYAQLADAGTCTCGAEAANQAALSAESAPPFTLRQPGTTLASVEPAMKEIVK